jgi:hypothetical protein
MGLYDEVTIPVELLKAQTDERIKKYAALIKGKHADFQTKNLDCSMQKYNLRKVDDKYIFYKDVVKGKFVDSKDNKYIFGFYFEEESRTEVAQDITATFCAFDYFNSDTLDIVIDLKIKVIDGVFVSMECIEYEEQDPKLRIKNMEETIIKIKESEAYYKTFRGKSAVLIRKILLSFYKRIHKFNSWLHKLAFKL